MTYNLQEGAAGDEQRRLDRERDDLDLRLALALAEADARTTETLRQKAEAAVQRAQAYADEANANEVTARRRVREIKHHGLATTCYECGVGDLDSSG